MEWHWLKYSIRWMAESNHFFSLLLTGAELERRFLEEIREEVDF